MNTLPKVTFTAPNHCIIELGGVQYFQSYNSIVAKRENGKTTVGPHWDYSSTTVRHLFADFRPYEASCTGEMRKAIKNGIVLFDETLI